MSVLALVCLSWAGLLAGFRGFFGTFQMGDRLGKPQLD